jgi:Rrf2 family protein
VGAVPASFLSKILGELRVAGILSAKRGYAGGYALTRQPCEISIANVVTAIGSRDLLSPVPTRAGSSSTLVDQLIERLRGAARDALQQATLGELCDPARAIAAGNSNT